MAIATNDAAERRFLLIGFAGFALMLSGAVTIVQGLWALDHTDDPASREVATQLSYANLEAWGWIMLAWGVVAIVAAIAVFGRKEWARWLGIVAASVSLLLVTFWVFAFPIAALTIVLIDFMVISALFAAGKSDQPIA